MLVRKAEGGGPMKWLYKLEYKYGKNYIRRLMSIVVIGMAVVYFLELAATPTGINLYSLFSLNRAMIAKGQIWRLVTFIFLPPNTSALFLLITLYFYYMIGSTLENQWGGFRLNMYYLFGVLGAILSMLVVGYGTNEYVNLSLFLAFATLAPDTQFTLFFIIPIKAKWMALAYAAFLGIQLIFQFLASPASGLILLVSLAFSLLNYALFFGRTLINAINNQIRISRNRRNWNKRNR